jgi:hypothetical protein
MSVIKILEGGRSNNEMADAMRKMAAEMPILIENVKMLAQLQRAKFDALKDVGFTDEQALELCKNLY